MPAEGSAATAIGFPDDFRLFMLEGEEKRGGIALNTKAQRLAINDQDAAWIENYLSIGIANTRALYDQSAALFTSATIINISFYNIGATSFAIVFKLDGSAVQVRLSDGATTVVGAAGTFFAAGNSTIPAIAQWANSGILIVSNISANAYWAWDGTLHSPGDATSPVWLNGGTPTAMPLGVAGGDIEIFLSRVWIVSGTNILTSAASNGATFTAGAGGLTRPATESYVRNSYIGIRQANGYLYVFGDSEVAYITNVQQSGATTTYQFTVIDQQIGTPWRDTIIAFGRSLVFGNVNGLYAVYGSTANKISDDLDGIWNKADFATLIPSASTVTLFGIKCLVIAVRTVDPTTNTMRNLMAIFDGKKWAMASQGTAPLIIAAQETNSVLGCWGSDGVSLFQCFTTPNLTLTKKLQSKLWGGELGFIALKQLLRFYAEVQPLNNTTLAISLTIDSDTGSVPATVSLTNTITFINNANGVLQFQNNALQNLFFQTQATITINTVDGSGYVIGYTITTTSPDFIIERTAIGYKYIAALY